MVRLAPWSAPALGDRLAATAVLRMRSERGRRRSNDHDVDRARRGHAAPCAAILHHAGDRGQEERRARAGGGRRYRQEAQGAQARSLDHLLQRSRRAVLPQRGAAVHGPCRRRGERRFRRPQVSLEDSERDRLRDRAPALPAELRSRLHQHGQDRLCDRDSADPYRPHRSGAADLRECLPAAAAHHGALLLVRRRRSRAPSPRSGSRPWCCRAAACRIFPAPTAIPIPN